MPACPIRSWSASTNDAPRPDTMQAKEMNEKLKKMMAERNAFDQRFHGCAEAPNLNKPPLNK
jgi:hypothetical protein